MPIIPKFKKVASPAPAARARLCPARRGISRSNIRPSSRVNYFDAPRVAKLLRLVFATQPRSGETFNVLKFLWTLQRRRTLLRLAFNSVALLPNHVSIW